MIVVDASLVLAADDLDDPHNGAARALVEGPEAVATIDFCAFEMANVAIRVWRNPRAAERLIDRFVTIERGGNVVRVDRDLVDDACSIADEHGITVYDAAYVAAARRLDARLVSCDVRDLVNRGLAELPTP